MNCIECHSGTVLAREGTGRTASYKGVDGLPIPDYVFIPTCNNCGARYVSPKLAATLDAYLGEAHKAHLAARVATRPKACNMHADCEKADVIAIARDGKKAAHCWSDDCEDCFPK